MIYPENTTRWKIDDIVIHDADAKEAHMLMKVIGFATVYGQPDVVLVRTRYLRSSGRRSKDNVYENELKYLHDPARFGIKVEV